MSTPDDHAKQTVVDAFGRGAQIGALDNRYVKLMQLAMQGVGLELARNVRPEERASLAIPVQVVGVGKVSPLGAVMLLEHRIVLAWGEGTLRPKIHSTSCALAEVTDVRTFRRKVGRVSAQLDAISFQMRGRPAEIVLHSEVSNQRATFMLGGILDGSVAFNWDTEVVAREGT